MKSVLEFIIVKLFNIALYALGACALITLFMLINYLEMLPLNDVLAYYEIKQVTFWILFKFNACVYVTALLTRSHK